MKKFVITFCLLVMSFSWSIAQNGLTTEERESIKETVKNQSQEFWNLFTQEYNDENLKRILNLLLETDNETWIGEPAFWIRNNNIFYTKDEIKEGFEKVFTNRESTPTKIKENYFAVLAPDLVIEVLTQDYYILFKNGYRASDFEASYTIVWVLKENQWKILHFHQSRLEKE